MSFLYPLFFLAGLTIAIPVLIHLFNLRRYKTVYFPNTGFLKNIQLHSRKQSQVRYKWLLALRILFLLSLILAFAQPFFNTGNQDNTGSRMQVLYLDNSSSMSVKKGHRNLLETAKDAARRQLRHAAPGSEFILLTNDRPVSYQPVPPEKALAALDKIDISSSPRSAAQVFATVQGLIQSEAAPGASVYYYSDFQQNAFPAQPDPVQLKNIHFYGMPVSSGAVSNVFIDTAFLTSPVLQAGQSNRLVVRSRLTGRPSGEPLVLQLSVNGQVKNAATLAFNEGTETPIEYVSTDTLNFQVNDAGWQRIMLTVNDVAVRFDDTFRITARSASNLSVLVLNERQPNPFIQAAFRAYNGFRMDQRSIGGADDWKQYNLVILNDVTRLDDPLAKQIAAALQQGQSICIFPGRTADIRALNEGLGKIADIRITGVDTASQPASSLQPGSDLVRDLFERIPENVQLPVATWHYTISAGLSANQQSVLSFRNGDPLFAQYAPSRGKLYLSSTAANLQSGNFPGSYFFAPFLYQMTTQSGGGDVYAVTAGDPQPVFVSMSHADDRNMIHVYGENTDLIPPQRPSGAGADVFLGQVIRQPGFYTLSARGNDSIAIALNQSRTESQPELWNIDKLRNGWKGSGITWLNPDTVATSATGGGRSSFPLWKVCVILALLMLAAESYMLAGGYRKQTVAPQ